MNKKYPNVIMRFLSYKLAIQNRSELTVEEYGRDLKIFFEYIVASREEKNIEDVILSDENVNETVIASVTADDIYGFLLYLVKDRKNSPSMRARRLSAVKSFYKYHVSKVYTIKENPAKDIESPSVKQALPKYLDIDESIRLLESVREHSKAPERDHCILILFLNCGIRLSELVGIDLTHISSDMNKMQVTGKGAKTRVIYLNSACKEALKHYIGVRQQNAAKYGKPVKDGSKDALFLSERNQRISNKTVQWLVKKYLEAASLGGMGYSTHKLRHTAATLMYNSGNVDILTLKDILGHEQLNTTQIYTHVSDKKSEEAMDANPLANYRSKK